MTLPRLLTRQSSSLALRAELFQDPEFSCQVSYHRILQASEIPASCKCISKWCHRGLQGHASSWGRKRGPGSSTARKAALVAGRLVQQALAKSYTLINSPNSFCPHGHGNRFFSTSSARTWETADLCAEQQLWALLRTSLFGAKPAPHWAACPGPCKGTSCSPRPSTSLTLYRSLSLHGRLIVLFSSWEDQAAVQHLWRTLENLVMKVERSSCQAHIQLRHLPYKLVTVEEELSPNTSCSYHLWPPVSQGLSKSREKQRRGENIASQEVSRFFMSK